MAIYIRDIETDRVVRKLALTLGVGLTEAIRISAENELKRLAARQAGLHERVAKIQARVRAYPMTGLKADKAFFDELSGLCVRECRRRGALIARRGERRPRIGARSAFRDGHSH
jgi:antitoxin VapB